MLKEALKKRDFSEDATILAKAAMIIRNDTFNHQCFKFNGCFSSQCQENSSLKSLISLIYIQRPKPEGSRQTGVSGLSLCWTVNHV